MNLCRVQSKQEEAAASHLQPKTHPAILELDLSVTSHLPKTSASQKEGLTEEVAIQRTHAAEAGSLPLLSAFIPSLQSPGNQGRGRANEKGPGT